MDERKHLRERLLGRRRGEIAQQPFALALEDGHIDRATSLAVLADELLEVRARMPRLVLASQAQRGWEGRALPAGQDTRRGALGHGLFRLPVLVMHGHHPVGKPGGRGAILAQAFGIAIASQRIDHRRDHDDAAYGAIDRRGARREG